MDKQFACWDLRIRDPVRFIKTETEVTIVALANNGGDMMASGDVEGVVCIWGKNLEKIASVKAHSGRVMGIDWIGQETVVSGGKDNCVCFTSLMVDNGDSVGTDSLEVFTSKSVSRLNFELL